MTELSIATIGATKITVPPDDLEALKGSLRGAACLPDERRLRRGAHDLERDDRPQAGARHPLRRAPPT